MTLPSLLAAAISAGVIAVGSGGAARSGVANTVIAAAPEALSMSRRESRENCPARMCLLPGCGRQRSSTRQRSAGRRSQTRLPCAMLCSGAVTTRSMVPSPSSAP